jgi:hypothetical protein
VSKDSREPQELQEPQELGVPRVSWVPQVLRVSPDLLVIRVLLEQLDRWELSVFVVRQDPRVVEQDPRV